MKIALAYNVKINEPSLNLQKQIDIEFDSPEVIEGIKRTIEELGHSVLLIEADETAYYKLKKNSKNIDLLFNIAEGLYGDARESQIPIFCEILKIPYTHSTPTTHAIKLNKHLAKILVKSEGIKVPKSIVVNNKIFELPSNMHYPLIVKPNTEGSSKGISDDCVVKSRKNLNKKVEELINLLKCEVIVEEYIDGREFTVGILGTPPVVLPIIEQKFDFLPSDMNKIAGYELKWIYEDNLEKLTDAYDCPASIDNNLKLQIEETSLVIYKLFNCYDAARIDYRLSNKNELFFIEINTLPGINPDINIISYFPIAARQYGLSYKKMVQKIIESACVKCKL